MRFHLERQTAAHADAGVPLAEARRRAHLDFGALDAALESCRDVGATRRLETFLRDLRYGLRQLRRNPGFTVVVLLTLALGIGANTAVFSVVNGVLLNPLPYPSPNRLVSVDARKPDFPRGSISYPNFLDWHRLNQCFSFFAASRGTGFLLTGAGEPEELNAAAITSDFFPMLGIAPVLGQPFQSRDDAIGASHVVAISTGLWKRKFAASPRIIGREISLDGRGYSIVAVYPGHLDLPMTYFDDAQVYLPLGEFPNPPLANRSAGLGIHGIARLKPGVTLRQARADLGRLTGQLAAVYPESDRGMGATLTPLKAGMVAPVRGFLLLLLTAVGFVLLIVCMNVANLLLARLESRNHELAVRAALGAGRGRLLGQLVTESMLLAAAGGLLGFGLAAAGTRAALAALPATLPRAADVGMDGRVLAFTVLISLGAGLLFAFLPAWRITRQDPRRHLRQDARGTLGAPRRRARSALLVGQIAAALVLLAGAGLLLQTLARLWAVNPGFESRNVLTFNLALPPRMNRATPDSIRAALRSFDAAIAAVPGVQAVSLSWGAFPMYSEDDQRFWVAGEPRPSSQSQMHALLDYIVGPGYLAAMRLRLLAGRFISPSDNERSRPVVVVDEVLARKYFPAGHAVGQAICRPNGGRAACFTIIGVVGHVKQWGLAADTANALRAQAYFPFMQLPADALRLVPSNTSVVVRSGRNPVALIPSLRRASRELNPETVLTSFETMHDIVQSSLAPRRFAMVLFVTFAILALLLAAIGIYGVISYSVGQRTREIGVRMAMGAQRADVLRAVLKEGLKLTALGIACGAVATLALTRFLSQLLYGVTPTDPTTLAAVALLLAGVALLATLLPARRAARTDPMVALR